MQSSKYKMTSFVSSLQAAEREYADWHSYARDSLSCSCGELGWTVSSTTDSLYHTAYSIYFLPSFSNDFHWHNFITSCRNVENNNLASTVGSSQPRTRDVFILHFACRMHYMYWFGALCSHEFQIGITCSDYGHPRHVQLKTRSWAAWQTELS